MGAASGMPPAETFPASVGEAAGVRHSTTPTRPLGGARTLLLAGAGQRFGRTAAGDSGHVRNRRWVITFNGNRFLQNKANPGEKP
jgi:hypothetical protein